MSKHVTLEASITVDTAFRKDLPCRGALLYPYTHDQPFRQRYNRAVQISQQETIHRYQISRGTTNLCESKRRVRPRRHVGTRVCDLALGRTGHSLGSRTTFVTYRGYVCNVRTNPPNIGPEGIMRMHQMENQLVAPWIKE